LLSLRAILGWQIWAHLQSKILVSVSWCPQFMVDVSQAMSSIQQSKAANVDAQRISMVRAFRRFMSVSREHLGNGLKVA